MNSLVRFFVERYVFAFSIFLALVFFGITAAVSLGVDLLPEFDFPIVAVSTSYPGAGSQETSRELAEPIEDALATLPGISGITSFSGEGYSFVIAQFDYGVNVNQAAIDVMQRIDTIQDSLPDDAGTPVIQKFDPNDEPILNIALSAPGVDLYKLQLYAEKTLEPRLQSAQGVADVAVVGPVSREIQVLLEPGSIERYGLSPQQIAGAIGASSLTLPAGSLTVGQERLLLAIRNPLVTVRDVESILVDPVRGLRVTDVAVVRDSAAVPETFVRLNGEPVVILEVRKTSGENSVATAVNAKRALAGIALPDGYSTTIIGDTSVFITNSVVDTLRETLLAGVAVGLIVLLFVGRLGSTFSVLLAIPITMTGAVILFGLLGFTFNIVTLLAVTVAVGLVVDDSIVIAENVERYRAMGMPLKEAVFQGVSEVAVPVLTATMSLLAVFIPIAFLPGVVGQFFSQFGLGLAAMIVVSYLEAMFFLTVRLAYLPNPLPPDWHVFARRARGVRAEISWFLRSLRQLWLWALVVAAGVALGYFYGLPYASLALLLPIALLCVRYLGRLVLTLVGAVLYSLYVMTDRLVSALRRLYANSLRWVLTNNAVVLFTAALLTASLGYIVPRLSFNFVPVVDSGLLQATLRMPPGTPLARTDQVASLIEREFAQLPEVRNVGVTVGSSGGTLNRANAERARFEVELVSKRERAASAPELAAFAQQRIDQALRRYPEARLEVNSDSGAVPVDTGIQLTLSSSDREVLQERDEQARQIMRANPHLRNVGSSLEGTVSERVFVLESARLSGTGLTPTDVAQTIRAYNVGLRASNLREDGREIPIMVRMNPLHIQDEQTLLSLPVYASALQSYLPLGQLGHFMVQAAPTSINRSNQAYTATLTAEIAPGGAGQLQIRNELETAFAAQGVTDDQVTIGTGVGPDLLGDLVTYGPIAFGLALLLNYLVIASQFNSFRYPIYLLLTVPLALVGAFWLFYLTNQPLDVISVLGVVILIGLVTKNAILLLDVVVSHFQEGLTLKEALVEAGKLRLRPILMTALTVIIISLPLLLGFGEGSEFRRPLGLVILGGVVSSTFLTLFVVPAAFYRFERKRYEKLEPSIVPQAVPPLEHQVGSGG